MRLGSIKAWWFTLAQREQWILGLGGIAAASLLIWSLVWAPLQRERRSLEQRIAVMTEDVAWIQSQLPRFQQTPSVVAASAGSALSVVEEGLKQARLDANLKQLTPVGEGRVRVALESVSFNAMADWLESVSRQHSLGAEEWSARKVGPGAVDIELVLAAGAR